MSKKEYTPIERAVANLTDDDIVRLIEENEFKINTESLAIINDVREAINKYVKNAIEINPRIAKMKDPENIEFFLIEACESYRDKIQATYEKNIVPQIIPENASQLEKRKLDILNKVRHVLTGENYKNYIDTQSRFAGRYSINNILRIWDKNEKATYIMGYEDWKKYGRQVKTGAKAIQILRPNMLEKENLSSYILKNLNYQLRTNEMANFKVSELKLEVSKNKSNNLIIAKLDNQTQKLASDREFKIFMNNYLGTSKISRYEVENVYDVSDTVVPEHLYVSYGYKKNECVLDKEGNQIKNKRGQVKINNTPERINKFQPRLDMSVVAKDEEKMKQLFDLVSDVSQKVNGVPVDVIDKSKDNRLAGALGAYYRDFKEETPKGYILIDQSLDATKKCSVLFHEMGHSIIHNKQEIADPTNKTYIPRNMREIQAESVANIVANQFGIETDTSSFNYIAEYVHGFDLEEVKKSLDIIQKSSTELINDITHEIQERGLMELFKEDKQLENHLEDTPLISEAELKEISSNYVEQLSVYKDYFNVDTLQQEKDNLTAKTDKLMHFAGRNSELLYLAKQEETNIKQFESEWKTGLGLVEQLGKAKTQWEQNILIKKLESSMDRVKDIADQYGNTYDKFLAISKKIMNGRVSALTFKNDPLDLVDKLKHTYPELKTLTGIQRAYIGSSKFVRENFGKFLPNNPQILVNKIMERAKLVSDVAAKNGTFVEVNLCEKFTKKPILETGALVNPKFANKLIEDGTKSMEKHKEIAEQKGQYLPYNKCDVTIYTPANKRLHSLDVCMQLGLSTSKNLTQEIEEYHKNFAGNQTMEIIYDKYNEAMLDRTFKKIATQDIVIHRENKEAEIAATSQMTPEKVDNDIAARAANKLKESKEQQNEKKPNQIGR